MKIKFSYINFFLFFFLLLSLTSKAQDIPKNYFRSPVDFKITLSGTFAELRNNHFHAGIDIRTFTTGKKIYSIADGIVSRIKISEGGYGKALYISHPNGYTSVYAHLDKFSPEIESFIKSQQYKEEQFEIDVDLSKVDTEFKLKKGDFIAYSGNTGSSMGPHLHFELRETKTQKPINPMFLDLEIDDSIPPKMYKLYAYPLDKNSRINGKNTRQAFNLKNINQNSYAIDAENLKLQGRIGFAIHTLDFLNNSSNKCGINKLQLKINDSLITNYTINKFSFAETSYINSHIDYDLYYETNEQIHKTFIEPNNKLSFYSNMSSDGSYSFKENETYRIELSVSDFDKNTTKLNFTALGDTEWNSFPEKTDTSLFKYEDENVFSRPDIHLKFPKNCFYKNLEFDYSTSKDSTFLSPIHHISRPNIATNKHFSLSLKLNQVDKSLFNKLLIVYIDKNKKISPAGGIYADGYIKTKTKRLGDYAIALDTIAPTITTKTAYHNRDLKSFKFIDFTIKDNLAGIKSYRGEIDGEWVLFEFDRKKNRLFYTFDKNRLQANKKHLLKVTVEDAVGNIGTYRCEFTW